jgi:hypothetical protein
MPVHADDSEKGHVRRWGVTTQLEAAIALLAPLVLVAVVVELALTGDDEQPERRADPASPSVSSRRRLLKRAIER